MSAMDTSFACPPPKTLPATKSKSMATKFSFVCAIKATRLKLLDLESKTMTITEDKVRDELKRVIDPELFVNIVDLGLIYVVDIQPRDDGKQNVNVEMTLTSPMCPAGPQLVANSRQVIEELEGVGDIDIKVVMDPPWGPDKMTEDARDQLGIF
jgi:metal-sulfur cluster biosynthetic enzyme